jgi:hypothetical protein
VSRTAIVLGGEISVTVRFGLEELEDAKRLTPGVLIELVKVPEAPPAPGEKKQRIRKPRSTQLVMKMEAAPAAPPGSDPEGGAT